MPLNDAERAQLEEIERRLAEDHPDVTRTFRVHGHSPVAVALLVAAAVYFAALAVLSAVTRDVLPVLLALPPVAVALVLARRQNARERVPAAGSDGRAPEGDPPPA